MGHPSLGAPGLVAPPTREPQPCRPPGLGASPPSRSLITLGLPSPWGSQPWGSLSRGAPPILRLPSSDLPQPWGSPGVWLLKSGGSAALGLTRPWASPSLEASRPWGSSVSPHPALRPHQPWSSPNLGAPQPWGTPGFGAPQSWGVSMLFGMPVPRKLECRWQSSVHEDPMDGC